MTIKDLQGKRIGILGFGQEGQAVLEYLTKYELAPVVYDRKLRDDWLENQRHLAEQLGIETVNGEEYLARAIENCEVIFKSPGVLLTKAQLNQISEQQIILTSQTAWFFKHCPAKIIGVTGTKGKGTTSSLISEILKNSGHSVFLTGNIGKIAPLNFLDDLTPHDTVVFELSSFQLEFLRQSPWMGICLMVTNDHFDYHADQQEYWRAKSAIARYQTENSIAIYNADYEGSNEIGQMGKGQKYQVSAKMNPQQGARIDSTTKTITMNTGQGEVVISTANRKLLGVHNLENIAAASLAAVLMGIHPDVIEQTIAEFSGLPHRLQWVGEVAGVNYYDDSIATNPDTTLAAVRSFVKPVVLLLGGADKGLDYQPMLEQLAMADQLKHVVLMGQVGNLLYRQMRQSGFSKPFTESYEDFGDAVSMAKQLAEPGDVVLLSPAATSFDMFSSYMERGEKFSELVKQSNV